MTEKLKLLVVSHPCLEEVNRAVYRQLAQTGIDIHLVIPRYNDLGDGYRECAPIGNEPFPVTILEPKGRHLRLRRLKGLAELVKQLAPSHILVDADPSTLIVNEMLWRTRGSKTQVWCMTAENLPRNYLVEAIQFLSRLKLKAAVSSVITHVLLKGAVNRLSRIFTISQDGTQAMKRMGFGDRVTQIPLGFDPNLFHPTSSAEREAIRTRLNLSEPTIAYFGRLSPEKGIDVLIRALGTLKNESWQFLVDHFTHAETPYIQQLQRLIDSTGIKSRVVFFEAKHSEMGRFMNAADVVVLPSVSTPRWKEQYGRVIPEAMACGKVVVGSRTGALPELIGDAGFLVPERDVEALAKQLQQLLKTQSTWVDYGRKAKDRANARLSLRTQAEIWANLLTFDSRRLNLFMAGPHTTADKGVDKIGAAL